LSYVGPWKYGVDRDK